jgi:hypothetical protein
MRIDPAMGNILQPSFLFMNYGLRDMMIIETPDIPLHDLRTSHHQPVFKLVSPPPTTLRKVKFPQTISGPCGQLQDSPQSY